MNAFGAQSRIGGANFEPRISRSARAARAGSPVSFETTRVAVTLPRVSTVASTTTRPCGPSCENDGVGVVVKRKSESGGQLPRRGRAEAAEGGVGDTSERAT